MSTEPSNNEKLFEELDSYNWEKDAEFQVCSHAVYASQFPFTDAYVRRKAGLRAILGPNPSPSQLRDLTIRARTFYYARKTNQTINFDAYKAHLVSRSPDDFPAPKPSDAGESTPLPQAGGAANDDPNPSFPTSFADIVALINSGAPIPGIMDIPPTVLADKATQPAASRRKKPWETQEEPIIPEGEGTFGSDRDRIIPQEEVSP